jgi:hypothetical protein
MKGETMPGKSGSSTNQRSNTTGKSGNDSGAKRREARGDPGARPEGGKHPPNRLFTSPQTEKKQRSRVRAAYSSRPSNHG